MLCVPRSGRAGFVYGFGCYDPRNRRQIALLLGSAGRAGCVSDATAGFGPSGTARTRPHGVNAAFILFQPNAAKLIGTSWPSRHDTGRKGGIAVRSALIAGTGSGRPACARVTGIRAGMVGNMALAQRTVLILAADDFEDMELLYPLYRLVEEDVEVTVAGLDDHPVRGKKGHGPVPVDTTVEQVAEGEFDALVIPGGFAPDKLRRSQAVLDLVRAFDGAGKPIAFICHAGWVPISARILIGRRATSVGAIRDDMVNAGADWVDEATVVDGNLISARTPADLGPWMKALLKALAIG